MEPTNPSNNDLQENGDQARDTIADSPIGPAAELGDKKEAGRDPASEPPAVEAAADLPPLIQHLPPAPDEDALLEGFVAYVEEMGIELYDAQEEAIYELLGGNNVILNTPTGSGKSLVAAAAHFAALADGRRSVYTAPIKALVSEKFFALCRDFGSERVGMVTGDASVNPDAPIICCTAEILANWALRDGKYSDVDVVVIDEFHYYGDPQRGWAWQLPLLELPHCQFLLMSATLGSTEFFEKDLSERTGRPTSLVQSRVRPVPLEFEYRRTTLHASIEDLLAHDLAPIYLVHFTQREATEAAQGFLSLDPLSKEDKAKVKAAIGNFRFDSPIGKDLLRFLRGGIGVHHAGLLPKYRLLVEKLAQDGLLKIICGTDTLGVGVNVPIRSVLFTQLCKYDGISTRTLSNREFQQIAGRAGRKGYDDQGTVWVQAPAHIVENIAAEQRQAAKANAAGRKAKKTVKKKQPDRGYAHWTEDTFTKLINGEPEALRSSFTVNHQMLMTLLDRPADDDGTDGCNAVQRLMTTNHEPRRRQRDHIRRSISIYRSLVDAEILEFPAVRDDLGRRVRVNFDLQDDFALHQPLSLWALEAIEQLDGSGAPKPIILEHHLSPGLRAGADSGDRGLDTETTQQAPPEKTPPEPPKERGGSLMFGDLAGMLGMDSDTPDDDQNDSVDSIDPDGDADTDAPSTLSDERIETGSEEPQQANDQTPPEADSASEANPEPESGFDLAQARDALIAVEDERRTAFGDVIDDELQHALDVVTIIESVQENPGVIVSAQVNYLKSTLMADMKSRGIEYEERMERLNEVQPPQPNKEWLYTSFDIFRGKHPWVGTNNVRPKSIVRDMFERAMTFTDYVNHYGLKRSEGVVLRYLSDVYKGLMQNIPFEAKTEELDDIIEWLGALVRQVDSSLIDEWERMKNPSEDEATTQVAPTRPGIDPDDITTNTRAFRVMVRNQTFQWVQLLAFKQQYLALTDVAAPESGYTSIKSIVEAMSTYWEIYDGIGVDTDARNGALHIFDAATGLVTQILDDPESHHEWRIEAHVDWKASADAGKAVLVLDSIGSPIESTLK